MQALNIAEVADALRGELHGTTNLPITSVCTDTRKGAQGALFFALRGDNCDGHQYVQRAHDMGAVAAVVEHVIQDCAIPQIVVSDALAGLGDAARLYLSKFALPVIGITGSVGKTSTREMVACALRSRLVAHANEANFNNEIGVPLTIFGVTQHHQALVLEMGMRGAGQIARLAQIARPTVGVITNIGVSHIELLGSQQAIAAAKGELLRELPTSGTAVLNADDPYTDYLRTQCGCAVVTYGVSGDFRIAEVTITQSLGTRFTLNGTPVTLKAPGRHHAYNAAAACAVATALGVPLTDAIMALEQSDPQALRAKIIETGNGLRVIDDTYNAAPSSIEAALSTLGALAAGGERTVAILGDMKELGRHSAQAHREVGEAVVSSGVRVLVTVGDHARYYAEGAQADPMIAVCHFDTTEQAAMEIRGIVQPNDIVLVKGSRAMAMEHIVTALTTE